MLHDDPQPDLSALKVGDRVAWMVSARLGAPQAQLAKVVRFTPTQIVVESIPAGIEHRFNRETGRKVGDHFTPLIEPDAPRVVTARAVATAHEAMRDVERMIDAARPTTIDQAGRELENMRTVLSDALRRVNGYAITYERATAKAEAAQ